MLEYEQGIRAGVEQGPNASEDNLDVTVGGRVVAEQVIDTPLFVIAAARMKSLAPENAAPSTAAYAQGVPVL
jgi:hypothetical protein